MEEKKNNKGLIIGMIIFLILCLIAVFYFMFKMVYVGTNNITPTDNTSSEQNTDTTNNDLETNAGIFTELTKYEFQEGEEKEITVNGNILKVKKENNKYLINNNEINEEISTMYVTNLLILFPSTIGQFGEIYHAYDFNCNEIEINYEDAQFSNLRVDSGKLMVDAFMLKTHWMEGYVIGNIMTVPEGMGACSKKLSDYPNIIEEHKNDILDADYYFEYIENKLTLKIFKIKYTVEQLAENASTICVEETNE